MAMTILNSSPPILQRGRGKIQLLCAQLADHLKGLIADNTLKPGDKLPTTDQMVAHFNVNRATVRKAIAILKDQDLLYSLSTKGIYVGSEANKEHPATQDYKIIGLASLVIYPGHTGPFHLSLINHLTHQLTMRNYGLNILPFLGMNTNTMDSCLNMMRWLDGVIYLGSFPKPFLRKLISSGPPSVIIDTGYPNPRMPAIHLDNAGGAFLALEHLYELGHRHIGVISGFKGDSTTEERMSGVTTALETFSDLTIVNEEGHFQPESGIKATDTILNKAPGTTALFYLNDEMAMASMPHLQHRHKLSIPKDLSVIGFDNIDWSQAIHPGLTTIDISTAAIAKGAGSAIDRLFGNSQQASYSPTTIPAQLIQRASTAPPLNA